MLPTGFAIFFFFLILFILFCLHFVTFCHHHQKIHLRYNFTFYHNGIVHNKSNTNTHTHIWHVTKVRFKLYNQPNILSREHSKRKKNNNIFFQCFWTPFFWSHWCDYQPKKKIILEFDMKWERNVNQKKTESTTVIWTRDKNNYYTSHHIRHEKIKLNK